MFSKTALLTSAATAGTFALCGLVGMDLDWSIGCAVSTLVACIGYSYVQHEPAPPLGLREPQGFIGGENKTYKKCPDCGGPLTKFFSGPSGGMSTNVLCSSCLSELNIMPLSETSFMLIGHNGKVSAGRAKSAFGVELTSGFQFQLDGRPAGPVRTTRNEAQKDAISGGYAVRIGQDAIKLDSTQGAGIAEVLRIADTSV